MTVPAIFAAVIAGFLVLIIGVLGLAILCEDMQRKRIVKALRERAAKLHEDHDPPFESGIAEGLIHAADLIEDNRV